MASVRHNCRRIADTIDFEQAVAARVPRAIVDRFEVVDVEVDDGQRTTVSPRPCEFAVG
jgi:hypothetical protein